MDSLICVGGPQHGRVVKTTARRFEFMSEALGRAFDVYEMGTVRYLDDDGWRKVRALRWTGMTTDEFAFQVAQMRLTNAPEYVTKDAAP